MKRLFLFAAAVLMLTACEKAMINEDSNKGDVTLSFHPTAQDMTRGTTAATYFSKLNLQIFDQDGNKVFDKVKTQLATDDNSDFCEMSLKMDAGKYTIVAVGHSSTISATIKSPEVVQFTASNGEKLTDTFCHCSTLNIEDGKQYVMDMYRVGAMVQFVLTDETVPDNFAYFLMEYTGGSANFNPTSFEGITKSSQSEKRACNDANIYQCYTFPYMAKTGTLKMTLTALDADNTIIRKRVFEDVPVTRNRITTYTGHFFEDGDGTFTQSDFGFLVNGEWDGEDKHTF